MCKCCQSCLETFYWHCFEKHCCYDESIALYSEEDEVAKATSNGVSHQPGQNGPSQEKQPEKNNNGHHFDNMSFYDSVAIIAHRAIFTIEPLKKSDKERLVIDNEPKSAVSDAPAAAIVEQPKLRTKTVEDETDKRDSIDLRDSNLTISEDAEAKTSNEYNIPTITEDLLPKSPDMSLNNSTDSIDNIDNICFSLKGLGGNLDFTKSVPCNLNQNMLTIDEEAKQMQNKHRKQSLHERRVSRSIHLQLMKDHRMEVPIIRQNSIPKFYLDTPTENQIDSALVRSPSMALSTPVAPNNEFIFDLKSIVQMERERSHNSINKIEVEPRRSKDLSTLSTHLGNKIKSIKRHASAVNLQNRTN